MDLLEIKKILNEMIEIIDSDNYYYGIAKQADVINKMDKLNHLIYDPLFGCPINHAKVANSNMEECPRCGEKV